MIRKLLVVTALIGVINAQGLIAKGKAKLEEIETMVRDNAAKLTIKTPDSFSGGRQDMVKVTQMVKVRSEKTLLGIKGLRSTNTWAKFATIGDNVEVVNLNMGKFNKKVKGESSLFTRVVSRPYDFQISIAGDTTLCECESKTEKTIYWPIFLFKDRRLFFPGMGWLRQKTSKTNNYLKCTITNSSGGKDKLRMTYTWTTKKFGFKEKIAMKIIPEDWRDDGIRLDLQGTLTFDGKPYALGSSYDYDSAVMGDNSLFGLLKPPIGYTLSSSSDDTYYMVKDPSKFRVANLTPLQAGPFYASIMAAYFYQPTHDTFKSLTNGKRDTKVHKKKDFFRMAKSRGALGLF